MNNKDSNPAHILNYNAKEFGVYYYYLPAFSASFLPLSFSMMLVGQFITLTICGCYSVCTEVLQFESTTSSSLSFEFLMFNFLFVLT